MPTTNQSTPLLIDTQINEVRMRGDTALAEALDRVQLRLALFDARFRSLAAAMPGQSPATQVNGMNLAELSVGRAKIGNLAVGSAQIDDLAVLRAKIALLAVGTAQIDNLAVTDAQIFNLDAAKITTGFLAAARIAVAAIDATKLNLKQIIVVSLALTNNSPAAGKIAWSACLVYWNGNSYSISSGSTSSTTNIFVYWDAGNTTFTAADSFTPQINRFLIATNNSGTADEAWNKLPSVGVQEANLAFTLLQGFQVQPLSTVANILVATNGTTTIINTSPAKGGVLLTTGIRVSTTITTARQVDLRYTIDGATPQVVRIYNDGTGPFWGPAASVSSNNKGDGTAVGDFYSFNNGIGFKISLLIEIVVSGGASGAGAIDVTILYATKI